MSKQNYDNIPENLRPVSPWSYFGHGILYSIPVLGFIILLVQALGSASNVNIRNYARSYFCGLVLVLIIVGVIVGLALAGGGIAAIADKLTEMASM